ncbi:MAG TPA: hypothetical protein VFG48_00815 [Xanthomonadales bacterium]|nr:hypothetical protein [Xanthomonadales bacterium]
MKKVLVPILFTLAVAVCASPLLADTYVAAYNCELNDGKKMEELQAANSTWLKWVRANVNPNINSEVGTAVVGKLDMFLFVDTYPDLATWAATRTAIDNDAPAELEGLLNDIAECTESRLWKIQPTP